MRVRSTGRGSLTGQQRQAAVRASTVRSRTSLTGTNQPGHVQGPGPSRVERFERGAATVGRNAVAATQTGARLGSAQAQSVESKIEAQGQLDLDGQTRGMYQRSTRRMAGAVLGRSNNPVNRVAGRMVGNRSRAVGGAVKDASVDGAQLDYEETVARLGRHGARTVKKPVQRAAGRVTWKLVKVEARRPGSPPRPPQAPHPRPLLPAAGSPGRPSPRLPGSGEPLAAGPLRPPLAVHAGLAPPPRLPRRQRPGRPTPRPRPSPGSLSRPRRPQLRLLSPPSDRAPSCPS